MSIVDRVVDALLGRIEFPERSAKDAEVERLMRRSDAALRRAERLVRIARVDAEMSAASAKERAER